MVKPAQTELERIHGINKNRTDITLDAAMIPVDEKWDGDLLIEDYPELEEIDLTGHSIDGLIIKNCPKLRELNLNGNDTKKIDLSQLTLDPATKKPVANTTLTNFWANNNGKLEEINLKNCTKVEGLKLQHCGTIKKFLGGEDFDESLKVVDYEGTNGLSFAGTSHLKELKDAKEAVNAILGTDQPKKRKDPSGRDIDGLDIDALKTQLIVKGSENPSSPAKNELDAIKSELGLGKNAAQSQIIAKIRELMGPGYISKVSLTSDAEDSLKGLGIAEGEISKLSAAASARDVEINRNKLVSDRFKELQSKLNHAHYINIGLGTLSVGVLIILTWMILKDRKLLPSQEDEEVKD